MAFTSVIQGTNVFVGLILLTTGTNVTTLLMCVIKFKSGLKLVRMEKYTCKFLLRKKNLNIGIPMLFCEIKVCPKAWAYFTSKLGWLKTNAGTNIGPQNDMYLYSPGILGLSGFKQTNF